MLLIFREADLMDRESGLIWVYGGGADLKGWGGG